MTGEGASAHLDLAEKWQENVKPVITKDAPKGILNWTKWLFYNAQRKRTLEVRVEKCQGGKGYEDCKSLLCWCAD